MNSIQKKSTLAAAMLLALEPLGGNAWADPIAGITVTDVGSTVSGAYSPTLDGRDGGFRFNVINPETYLGVSLWTGDVGTGTILGQGTANPTGSFSTGFLFAGTPFVPFTYGAGVDAEIGLGNVLTVNIFDLGGNFGGSFNFNLPPDPGTLSVNFVEPGANPGEFLVSFQWEHYITSADDPSGSYVGFNARWIVEGVATVVDSAPLIFINGSGGVAGDITSNVAPNTTYVDEGAVCEDVVDGEITDPALFTTVINNPNDPSTGPEGSVFTVDYTCEDSLGNITTATRTVQAGTDTTSPVITLGVGDPQPGRSDAPDGSTVDILVGVPYVDAGASCEDNRDGLIGTVPPSITGSPSFIVDPDPPLVDTSTPSTGNTITFTCTDSIGNPPTVAARTVNVLADTEPPVISLLGANPLTVAVGSVYEDPGAVCVDANPVDPDPVDISANLDINPTTIDTSATGTFTVTYDCSDASGNLAPQQTRTVIVTTDTEPPDIVVGVALGTPGNKREVINPRARGGIWVTVLSDTDPKSPFDPSSQVDIATVEFGPDGANAIRYKVIDTNDDGLGDLLLRFDIPETGIACGDTEAMLTGETFDGRSIEGTASIKTVGCKPNRYHSKR